MSVEPDGRAPLNERDVAWMAIEIAVVIAVWIVGTNLLLDQARVPSWLSDVISYAGGFGFGFGIAWWRMVRHGPLGPPKAQRSRFAKIGALIAGDAKSSGLLLGGVAGLIMSVVLLLQARSDHAALAWGIAFGCLAVIQLVLIQLVRYLRRRIR
jgi:hypothetical protein